MRAYDPLVLVSRQTLMQRVADYVRTGHVHWTTGEIAIERAPALVRKFARLYDVDLDRNRRFRAKQLGEADAVLLLLQAPAGGATLRWVLLVTAGEHPAHQLERLDDATTRDGRVHLFDYELLHMAKPGRRRTPAASQTSGQARERHPDRLPLQEPEPGRLVLTWRMRAEVYEMWRNRALGAARGHNTFVLETFLADLYRAPGFWGIRQQVGKIVGLLRREHRRRHGSLAGCPKLPRLYYVTRRPNRGVRLSALLSSQSQRPTPPMAGVEAIRPGGG